MGSNPVLPPTNFNWEFVQWLKTPEFVNRYRNIIPLRGETGKGLYGRHARQALLHFLIKEDER